MKKPVVLATALAFMAFTSALFADISLNLGHIDNNQTVSISFNAEADSYLYLVNDDTNQEAAFITIAVNYPTSYHYITSQGSQLPGVSATDFSAGGGDITGLPAGNYHFVASTLGRQSYYQYTENYQGPNRPAYTFEYFDLYGDEASLECFIYL